MQTAGRVACFMPPGEGKTAATLTALLDLGKPRTLVLAPARVADTVWGPEAESWSHLRTLKVGHATGDAYQRDSLIKRFDYDVVTLSYENFPWLIELLGDGQRMHKFFDAIVFDELSRMKNVGSVKFRRFRAGVRSMKYRFGLTGTPVGNHLIDLWGEMYMVADEQPLGPSKGEYVARYFRPTATVNGRVVGWEPFPSSQREIEQRIKPFAFMLKPSATTKFQTRTNIIKVNLPPAVEEMARNYVADLKVKLASGTDLYAFSRTTAAMQVRQMVSGAVYVKPVTPLGEPAGERRWEHIHGAKVKALEELVGELQGEPLLVFYWFQHERDRILAHFNGVAKELDSASRIEQWNKGKVEILLAHPASAGHGLNLQYGGFHQCWFTLPYSLEMYMQANGRLPRPGQRNSIIYNHVLLAGRSDEAVLALLAKKDAVQDQLLDAVLR